MKIHHVRNATLVIETGGHVILVDPMLGKMGEAGPPFTLFRYKPRRNPIVDLPDNAEGLLDKVSHCLITHLHPDHIDKAGFDFLRARLIPVTCSVKDEAVLAQKGLNIVNTVDYWKEIDFLGGRMLGIPAVHGYGFVARLMGNVMGFFIRFPDDKSIYLSSDTIYTDDVHKVLSEFKPDVSVVACGTARLDVFQPLLMRMDDILKFTQNSPGSVLANHMEAVNHCPTTRSQLAAALQSAGLSDKVFVPLDGESKLY